MSELVGALYIWAWIFVGLLIYGEVTFIQDISRDQDAIRFLEEQSLLLVSGNCSLLTNLTAESKPFLIDMWMDPFLVQCDELWSLDIPSVCTTRAPDMYADVRPQLLYPSQPDKTSLQPILTCVDHATLHHWVVSVLGQPIPSWRTRNQSWITASFSSQIQHQKTAQIWNYVWLGICSTCLGLFLLMHLILLIKYR